MDLLETLEHFFHRQQFVGALRCGRYAGDVIERDALPNATTSQRSVTARVVHQDPSHDARGDGEELPSFRPVCTPLVDKLEVRFVDEIGRRERVVRALSRELSVGNRVQFGVHTRQKLIGSAWRSRSQGEERVGNLAPSLLTV
jgi:hypothetical protein